MYKIIGADGKEYGPITGEQIRFWISEGRVNGQTRVCAEGTTDWKTLADCAEFGEALGGGLTRPVAPMPAVDTGAARAAALQAVKGPAIALKVTAIIGLVMVALGLVVNILSLAGVQFNFGMQQFSDPQFQKMIGRLGGGVGIFEDLIGGVVGVVVLMGAARMQNLQKHQLAFTASILAMVPCVSPCCLLGLPFGIWALVVLSKPEVKSQFT
jgi:hypothetical protein